MKVLLQISGNCTEEIPVTWRNGRFFVDPISYVIKMAASPTWCNSIAPLRWNIARNLCCANPAIWEWAPLREPACGVEAVNNEEDKLLGLGLGRSVYSKEQVEEFLLFQDSQGTRKAYLAETAELGYGRQAKDRTWGLWMG